MKVFPSTCIHTLTTVTKHNATPPNRSTTQVLLSNPQEASLDKQDSTIFQQFQASDMYVSQQ